LDADTRLTRGPLQLAPKIEISRSRISRRGRGIYRKRADRLAAITQPCAWEIGNKKSFSAARARAYRGICLDLDLHGKEKAALAACLDHMNAGERWSCFASIKTISKEAGINPATCWRAIRKADGKHILTKWEKRSSGARLGTTHITIHPNHSQNYIARTQYSEGGLYRTDAKTISHASEQNLLKGTYKERGIREMKEENFSAVPHSPNFIAWRAYYRDQGPQALVRELDRRELEGRAFNFKAPWPPGHQVG
jgi:hypothetical protein